MAPSTRSTSPPEIDATRARQGLSNRNMLWVLIASLALVIVGFLIAYAWHARDLTSVQHNARARHVAGQFVAPQPAGATRQNYETGGPLAPRNNGNPGQPDRSTTTEP
jgi:hypothetical protein